MGVVIGETAEIGDDVLMYQGVVLGGTTLEKGKRHPTLGNNVEMGTGSVALGDISIGDGARIGSGSVVIKSVPAGATVVGIPGRVVSKEPHPPTDLEHARLPDPIAAAIRNIQNEQRKLEGRLSKLERLSSPASSPNETSQKKRKLKIRQEDEAE